MKGRTRIFKTLFMIVLTLTMGLAIVACGRNTDKADVAEAKEALAIDLKDNSNLDNVTGNLGLPTTGLKDVKVTWTSSNAAAVSTTGTVTRQDADVTVTLTATLTKGDEKDEKPFTVKVIKKEVPAVTAEEALAALEVTGDDLNTDEAIYTTTKNVTLPTTSLGFAVNWESSNETALKTDGTVTRPVYGQPTARVILTAYIGSLDKEFIIDVLAIDVMPTVDVLSTARTQLILPLSEVNEDMTLPSQIVVEGVEDEERYTAIVTWASSDTSFITSNGLVTRPEIGEDDVMVTLTASISFGGETVTKDFDIRVLAETTPHETFEDFKSAEEHFLATAESGSDRIYSRINNVSFIGRVEDGLMFTDSQGQVFFACGSQDNAYRDAEKGKLYDIIGLLADYFGVTQINGTGALGATAPTRLIEKDGDPVEPTIKEVESIKELLPDTMPEYTFDNNEVVEDRVHNRFTMEYLRVEAKIYVKDVNDTYGVFIVDKDYAGDFSDIDASGKSVPYTDEAIVIYYSSNYKELQPLNGFTVTLDVVLYGLRDDRNIYNAVFLGTLDDVIVPEITDEQTVNAVKGSLENSTPTILTEATTINLPTELLDADIAWTSSHQDIIALDGTVTPSDTRVEVTLTATITKGDATATATIKVMVGELPVLTVQEALAVEKGELLVVKGTIIGYSANNTLVLHDETGAIAIFIGGNVTEEAEADLLKGAIGKVVVLEGQRTEYGGLEQVQHIVKVEVTTEEPHTAHLQDITAIDWTAATLLPHQNKLVSITDGTVSAVDISENGNVKVTIQIGEKTIDIRWDHRVEITGGANVLATAQEGDIINVINAPLSWTSNNPQIGYYVSNQVTLEADSNTEIYDVTFMDGEEELDVIKVADGRPILDFPTLAAKDGFMFVGWFTSEDVEWKSSDLVEEDVILTAKWLEAVEEVTTYSFAGLTNAGTYVDVPTDETVNDLTFTRLYANISASGDHKGIVLGIRSGSSGIPWSDAYLGIKEKLVGASKVVFDVTNWTNDAFHNLNYAEGIYIQTSTDGILWEDTVDFKADWNTDNYGTNTLSIDLTGDVFVRLYVRSAGEQEEYSLRLIVKSVEVHKLVAAPEDAVNVTFDLGYDGAADPTVVILESGEKVDEPTAPTRNEMNFLGWALEGETDVFDFDTPITEDITLVALWAEPELLTISEIVNLDLGTWVKFKGVVTGVSSAYNESFDNHDYVYFEDATGAINVYRVKFLNAIIGDVYEVVGKIDAYQGFMQMASVSVTKIEETITVPDSIVVTDLDVIDETYQSRRISFENAIVKSLSNNGRELVVTLNGKDIMLRAAGNSGDVNDYFLDNATVGDLVSVVGVYVGWSGESPRLSPYYVDEVIFEEASDADKLAAAKDALSLEAEYITEFELPTTGLHGVTITWVADPAANLVGGKLVIPAEDEVSVTLTATLSLEGLEAETKVFNVLLKAPVGDEEFTATVKSKADSSNMVEGSNPAGDLDLDEDIFEVSVNKGTPSSIIGLYSDLRIYGDRNSGDGNELVISVVTGYTITKVEIIFSSSTNEYSSRITLGEDVLNLTKAEVTGTVTYEDLDITSFAIKNTGQGGSSNPQVRINDIIITYKLA